ncbi:MAG: hypothetical protein K2N95_19380 [Lachnospiraceae bacterium]|nr:hypothetical protein [Lachnospiraceae bacterium]
MINEDYITEEESEKCQKVADAYAKELEEENIVLLNVGRYGFVMLQYCQQPIGIDSAITFTDSGIMFDFLWEEWFIAQLIRMAEELHMVNIDDDAIFDHLSREKQQEILDKRLYFAEKAGIERPPLS